MRHVVRVVVFNEDEDYAQTLRREWMGIEGVRIVAEFDEPALLDMAVEQFRPDAIVVHLDPMPDHVLPCAERLVAAHPDVAVVAISGSSDGQRHKSCGAE